MKRAASTCSSIFYANSLYRKQRALRQNRYRAIPICASNHTGFSLNEARVVLLQSSIEVVLIDYDSDDGKGEKLVRELKVRPMCPRMVAVSAHQMGNEALLDVGADAVCDKLQFPAIGSVLSVEK